MKESGSSQGGSKAERLQHKASNAAALIMFTEGSTTVVMVYHHN